MVSLFLFLAGIFLFTFLVGRLLSRIRVPWIFAALLLGGVASFGGYFTELVTGDTFSFLAGLGMFFMLFIIGFEIDLKEISSKKNFFIKATLFIISFEAILGSLLIHFVFGYDWLISLIVGFSFATVGEVVLIPILDEFKMINTKVGQAILGIGILDDLLEIMLLIIIVGLVGVNSGSENILLIIGSLTALFSLTFMFKKIKSNKTKAKSLRIEIEFLFLIFVLFLFLGIGALANAGALAAFLAGISLRTFIPKENLKLIESETKTVAYGFFAPLFFFSVGSSIDFGSLFKFPLLLLLVLLVSSIAKIVASLVISKGYLNLKESLILGIGLSVRFSTSIIVVKILFDEGLLNPRLYSVLVASAVILTFVVPLIFSRLILRWKLNKN